MTSPPLPPSVPVARDAPLARSGDRVPGKGSFRREPTAPYPQRVDPITPSATGVSPNSLLNLPGMVDALTRTEAELRTVVESGDPFLTEVARHLIDAGGKRVRPALAVTAAQVLDADPGTATHDVIRGGVAVELVHQG